MLETANCRDAGVPCKADELDRRYDDSLVKRMFEKVTVYEDKFMVEFKSVTSVDIER